MRRSKTGGNVTTALLSIAAVIILGIGMILGSVWCRYSHGNASTHGLNAKTLEERVSALSHRIHKCENNLHTQSLKVTGHYITRFPQIVSGSCQDSNSTGYIKSANFSFGLSDTSGSSPASAFTCSGVFGTRKTRELRRFGQWEFNIPGSGGQFTRAYVEIPGITLITGGKGVDVSAYPNVITAEIVQIIEQKERAPEHRKFGLWIMAGSGVDNLRYIIPLPDIPWRGDASYVLVDHIETEQQVNTSGAFRLFSVMQLHGHDEIPETSVVTVNINVK